MDADPFFTSHNNETVEAWREGMDKPYTLIPSELSQFANIFGLWWRPLQNPQTPSGSTTT
jgi:hypothetical protein